MVFRSNRHRSNALGYVEDCVPVAIVLLNKDSSSFRRPKDIWGWLIPGTDLIGEMPVQLLEGELVEAMLFLLAH